MEDSYVGHDQMYFISIFCQAAFLTSLGNATRYAQRMLIENALCDAVRFFHMDALSSAVGLKVDFDTALLVVANGLYRLVATSKTMFQSMCSH